MIEYEKSGLWKFMIILLVLMPISVSSSSAIILIDSSEYSLGETVTISLSEADSYTLSISSSENVYKYLGLLSDTLEFKPMASGPYEIKLYSGDVLLETVSFHVYDENSPETSPSISAVYEPNNYIFTDKDQYYVGEDVSIVILKDFEELNLVEGDSVYRFLGDSSQDIMFIASNPGEHTVEVKLQNGQVEKKSFMVLESADAGDINVSDTGTIVQEPKILERRNLTLRDSKGGLRTEILNIYDKNNGLAKADIEFAGEPDIKIKKIVFRNLDVSSSLPDIRIEKVPAGEVQKEKTLDAFAIDPTNLVFESAEVTITAVGTELWKCKDYDYDNRNCFGDFVKIATLVPGMEYTFTLTSEDPVFSQTGYLLNPSFDNDTTSWSELSENPVSYQWIPSDAGQNGVAEIYQTGRNKNYFGNYYQVFTLTIPAGTALDNINFSALWRINQYDQPGNVYIWIQDSTHTTTYCSWTQSFTSTTAWAEGQVTTRDAGCSIASFTPGTDYTFRLRCNLVTGKSIRDERCHWDETAVIVYYNDTQSPTINFVNETPDPVSIGSTINITANVTDNIEVQAVLADIEGVNYSLTRVGTTDIWYYDGFDTNIDPGLYLYNVYANDTSGNEAAFVTANFTISDETVPAISLESPLIDTYTNDDPETFYYNVSDASTIANCSLYVDGLSVKTNYSVVREQSQNISFTLSYGYHNWSVECYDNSTNFNMNISETWNLTFDNMTPSVVLEEPLDTDWVKDSNVVFNYTPIDDFFENCTLWGNFTPPWNPEQVDETPLNATKNSFAPVALPDGFYEWNVLCLDKAGNEGWDIQNNTFSLDSTPPNWSSLKTNPLSGVVYVQGADYQLNVTWEDALIGIDSVWITQNFSGSLQTGPPSGNLSGEYYFNVSDLAAGTYEYTWYANDSLGNTNTTGTQYYSVNKTVSEVNLLLNGTDGDYYIGLNEYVNLSASIIAPATGYIELYIDGVMINNGSNYLENSSQFTEEKAYNITVIYPTTQNHSYSYETHYVIVTDTTSPKVGLVSPPEGSWEQGTVIFKYYPDDNIDIGNCTLILDDARNETKNATNLAINNFTISGLTDGAHYWDVNCTDPTNNTGINGTPLNFRVDDTSPSAFNLISPDGVASSNLQPTFTWQQTTEDNFKNYSVVIDNDQGFGSLNYQYLVTNISNTSIIVGPLTDQRVWYWKVIAYDLAENQRTSTQVFNYTTDTLPPTLNLVWPENNTWLNYFNVTFEYTVTDFTELLNCSVVVNQIVNKTNYSIQNGAENNITVDFGEDGTYNWSVSCYDSAGNLKKSDVRVIHIDVTPTGNFNLSTPLNNTLSNNRNPFLNWTPTDENQLSNYTVEVANVSDFSAVLYTYYTYNVSHTNYSVADNWPDDTYYWKVTAYDYASNSRESNQTFIYRVDATPPEDFNLLWPSNGTFSTNLTPLLEWSQSSDEYFSNYTIYVSDNISFPYSNYTKVINESTTNFFQILNPLVADTYWYWYVTAYDNVSNAKNSSQIFVYITDTYIPVVSLESPLPGDNWTSSNVVNFEYNVTDFGEISNCTLVINSSDYQTIGVIEKNITQNILQSLDDGYYNWSVRCQDKANNTGYSESRLLFVNVTIPLNTLWETSEGGAIPAIADINLSYEYDFVEGSVIVDIPASSSSLYVNATYLVGGSGFRLAGYSNINFSAYFTGERSNAGFVSWWLYASNTTGEYFVCGYGDNNTGGAGIIDRTGYTVTGNCTSQLDEIMLYPGDSLRLELVVYNSQTQPRTYTHFWDNTNPSWIMVEGYRLGILNASFINLTNPLPGEGEGFTEQCNISCTEGDCINTMVHMQYNNSGTWTDIGLSGNITRNTTQSNPLVLGTINSSLITNFSLIGNIYSFGNQLRCFTVSDDDNASSQVKIVNVTDKVLPNVTLLDPENGSAYDPQVITFIYKPYDVRLQNCTLWGNFSGVWNYTNQTNSSPINDQNNTFELYLSYGFYSWNVECYDEAGNSNFAEKNNTVIVAGDMAINSSGILFSNYDPVEGEPILIYSNITNNANKNETDVVVQFWDGDPDSGGSQIDNKTFNISALGNALVNISWNTTLGLHNIFVVIDPPYGSGQKIEIDETNNKANKTLLIDAWQIYYGSMNSTFMLRNSADASFSNWFSSEAEGNLYITDTDTDAGISWSFLRPLTRNTSDLFDSNTLNDFEDLDSVLGITGFVDSVNTTFSSGGMPIALSSFIVFGMNISNVPIDNTTLNDNFVTGILWDSDDSSNSYYDDVDQEDVVFISRVNPDKLGAFGIYDYEIKIPSNLESYKGATVSVDLYYEIK